MDPGASSEQIGNAANLIPGQEDNSYILSDQQLLVGFRDIDKDTLGISNISVDRGTITKLGEDQWQLQPEENYFGEIAITYEVTDGNMSINGRYCQSGMSCDQFNCATDLIDKLKILFFYVSLDNRLIICVSI